MTCTLSVDLLTCPPLMTMKAPEVVKGQDCSHADVYALGIIAYEVLAGERPAGDLVACRGLDIAKLPEVFQPLVLQCCESGANDRSTAVSADDVQILPSA